MPELLRQLKASAGGLASAEALRRLQDGGPNELPRHAVSPWRLLLGHLWGPIAWMIELAALLSALVRDWSDLGLILLLLAANAGVGFWEEFKAGNEIAALEAQLAREARVLRDGLWRLVPARELVPGDVIRLRIGDIVPADARLLDGGPVEVDQSPLTGESLPVERERGGAVLSGSILRRGEADALVHATGPATSFARTARLAEAEPPPSHFQQAVLKIGDYLILVALLLITLILVVALFRGHGMVETLRFALVLCVASIPVAMPTVLSVTLAVGAERLARRRAVVTRLAAIEELAGIDILCSDKTGTLTQNRLSLGSPFCVPPATPEQLLRCAALASRAEDGDPIDAAVLEAPEAGSALAGMRIEGFSPFDPVSKRTEATAVDAAGRRLRVSKGAPQVILALADEATAVHPAVNQAVEAFACRGFRSLAVAAAEDDGPWRVLGVLPLFDPPRQDSRTTLEELGQLGITTKLITGDQVAIAREMAHQLGLGSTILPAEDLETAPGTPQASPLFDPGERIEGSDGFAQVFPEHKYRIVELLQRRGHLVGMTGDGVNDAPALKRADAGIAVSGASDAARSAADIVLLSPGLGVVVAAIRESRRIFQRMHHYAVYRIAETIRVLVFMTVSILVFDFYPLSALMIVLLALLNDGAILSIAYDRTRWSPRPVRWQMPVVLGVATMLGLAGVVATFGLLYLAEVGFNQARPFIQTLLYLKLSVAGHLTVFAARTVGPFWSVRPALPLLLAVVGTQLVATLLAVYGILMAPIGWGWALLVWGYSLLWFLVEDRVKLLAYDLFGRRPTLLRRLVPHRRLRPG
ncbi:plasma-membrane proton-efflux P-type ATPase [Cyanobium sp. PCC 7001]|uniref:plasma-membrane proton-efflux P-type ATPase n=1 Tax=Cyanobium sp. PCC 7001 TaxID=180281 RepID=UPI0001805036|nr:plasma-membrane proton-efflux P-type ATPase [Cyanobium sp. PCC 7001]EDY38004.1 plasma-membrane proton-efflux P-type ATPase [Cyanobium sp. PCC 7001]